MSARGGRAHRADLQLDLAISHRSLYGEESDPKEKAHQVQRVLDILHPLRQSGFINKNMDALWSYATSAAEKLGLDLTK